MPAEKHKRRVEGVFVKLMFEKRLDRGMRLMEFQTRCLGKYQIHEIVTTDQTTLGAGDRVDRVGYLGFVELLRGGVVEVGDTVSIGPAIVGHVLGFDETHFPNHYNILIAVSSIVSSTDLNLYVEQPISFGR